MKKKKIVVIQGGTSREREISLESAKSCIKAIKKLGHKVIKFDPKYSSSLNLQKIKSDVVFSFINSSNATLT